VANRIRGRTGQKCFANRILRASSRTFSSTAKGIAGRISPLALSHRQPRKIAAAYKARRTTFPLSAANPVFLRCGLLGQHRIHGKREKTFPPRATEKTGDYMRWGKLRDPAKIKTL